MGNIVKKEEVEEWLKSKITDELFNEALECAGYKQDYIYRHTKNTEVLQHWYLVRLTAEYAWNLTFSKFTMDLCKTLCDMEKEHSVKDQSAQTDIHIVTGNAL